MKQDEDIREYKISLSNCRACSISKELMVCKKFCSFYKDIHETDGKNREEKVSLFSSSRPFLMCY